MGLGVALLVGLIAVLAITLIIKLIKLTLAAIKKLILKHKEKKQKQKVAFADTKKIIDENAKEILENAPKMSMDELEKTCEETPYFIVDYDPETDQITSEFEGIKSEIVSGDVESFMEENATEGIVLFD